MLWADESHLVTNLIALGAGILTGAAAVGAAFLAGLKKVIQAKMERWEQDIRAGQRAGKMKHLVSVEAMAGLFDAAETLIRNEDCVDRVLLMTGANGGGVPTPDKPYNVGALFGRSTDGHKDPAKLYAGPLRVDAHYMKMISHVIRKQVVALVREQMPDCMLRGYYEAEGVVASRIYFLSLTPERLAFCSIASYKRQFTPGEIARIDAAVRRLRGLIDTDTLLQHKVIEDARPSD
jgi:hypothetical protein